MNDFSSVESRLLGAHGAWRWTMGLGAWTMGLAVKGGDAVMLLFRFEYETSVICHNLNANSKR